MPRPLHSALSDREGFGMNIERPWSTGSASALRLLLCAALALLLLAAAAVHAQTGSVVVNGVPLDRRSIGALEAAYRTRLVPGQYWYDRSSGLWGLRGGPSVGLIAPGLDLGGPMNARASVGAMAGITGVFINGREIHPLELQYLRSLYGSVPRARYWLDARGVAGYEGRPPQFNLMAAARARQPQRGGGYTGRGLFGSSGSDGSCSYYLHPNGSSVMTGRC
jgi:hypothetical protein